MIAQYYKVVEAPLAKRSETHHGALIVRYRSVLASELAAASQLRSSSCTVQHATCAVSASHCSSVPAAA